MVNFTRKFHPVGFGAFYTECHESGGREINVVYDCGTLKGETFIEGCIRKQFPKEKTVIDILFISHFHKDHINGVPFLIKHCIIKKVVIPFIPKADRALFVVGEGLDRSYEGLVLDTEAYFGEETEIIRISRNGENDIPVNSAEIIQPSGNPIEISLSLSISLKWTYVPFNYNYTEYVPKLKKKLEERGLDYDKLSDKKYLYKNINEVKRAFKEIEKDQNKTSLILFYGLIKKNPIDDCIALVKNALIEVLIDSDAGSLLNCVYFGDASLKDDEIVNAFKHEILEKFNLSYRTLQIPHHGSMYNFNSKIVESSYISVVSCDFKSYNLPDASVTKEIAKAGSVLVAVTDNPNTEFRECGKY